MVEFPTNDKLQGGAEELQDAKGDHSVRWATMVPGERNDNCFQNSGRIPHMKNAASAASVPERE